MAPAMHWSDLVDDPNDPQAHEYRRNRLGTWRNESRTRLELLRDLVRDRRVLDIGCVAHDVARTAKPAWLHAHLARAAASCVGVDYDTAGVAALRAQGFDVVAANVDQRPPDELLARAPFDVVVAGELIEHLDRPAALFDFARPLLSPDGLLVITTPNPHAPWRVRAGQRGDVVENVDHVVYLFPSGIAELADRAGWQLDWATTVDFPWSLGLRHSLVALVTAAGRRAVGRRSPQPVGRLALPLRPAYLSPLDVLTLRYRRGAGRSGATSVYALRLGAEPAGRPLD
jgi:2-polyprenyl-3-methyl-5-hydroxy-6-metoxy-1,4-benzoquinol methylase